ncbi:MAG: hypothetical protein WC343_09550 [Bacilli bacterium]|jgi:hypothetical protein
MWKRILCDWFGWHDWSYGLVVAAKGIIYSGRSCMRCGKTQRALSTGTRLTGWQNLEVSSE